MTQKDFVTPLWLHPDLHFNDVWLVRAVWLIQCIYEVWLCVISGIQKTLAGRTKTARVPLFGPRCASVGYIMLES